MSGLGGNRKTGGGDAIVERMIERYAQSLRTSRSGFLVAIALWGIVFICGNVGTVHRYHHSKEEFVDILPKSSPIDSTTKEHQFIVSMPTVAPRVPSKSYRITPPALPRAIVTTCATDEMVETSLRSPTFLYPPLPRARDPPPPITALPDQFATSRLARRREAGDSELMELTSARPARRAYPVLDREKKNGFLRKLQLVTKRGRNDSQVSFFDHDHVEDEDEEDEV